MILSNNSDWAHSNLDDLHIRVWKWWDLELSHNWSEAYNDPWAESVKLTPDFLKKLRIVVPELFREDNACILIDPDVKESCISRRIHDSEGAIAVPLRLEFFNRNAWDDESLRNQIWKAVEDVFSPHIHFWYGLHLNVIKSKDQRKIAIGIVPVLAWYPNSYDAVYSQDIRINGLDDPKVTWLLSKLDMRLNKLISDYESRTLH